MTLALTNTEAQTEIRSLLNYLAQATRDKDPKAVVQCYTADCVMFVLPPPLQNKGADGEGANRLETWFASWDGAVVLETRELTISASEEVAFTHALVNMTGRKTDGEQVDLWYRETNGLVREGGRWRIAHQHQSVRFLMDGSGKAALDLKPED